MGVKIWLIILLIKIDYIYFFKDFGSFEKYFYTELFNFY